jgi:hypothetical protein
MPLGYPSAQQGNREIDGDFGQDPPEVVEFDRAALGGST